VKEGKGVKIFCLGVIFISLVGIYGCSLFSSRNTSDRPSEGKSDVQQTIVIPDSFRFEDIPVPPGMTLDRKESFIYETNAIKTGLLIYEGKGEMENLASFYKQQMPKFQWRLLSKFQHHSIMLTFTKEGWACVIYLLPMESGLARIEVRTGPTEIKTSKGG
jgi:hypothetical protein